MSENLDIWRRSLYGEHSEVGSGREIRDYARADPGDVRGGSRRDSGADRAPERHYREALDDRRAAGTAHQSSRILLLTREVS